MTNSAKQLLDENDDLRRENTELRTELDLISGGWEHRIEIRRKLDRELENVRGELGLIRGELGIVREQRNTLREQLRLAHDRRQQVVQLLDETRAELIKATAQRVQLRQQLTEARNEQRIDGLRLYELICHNCPGILTEEVITKIALDTVDELDRAGGVTVYRARADHPWRAWPLDGDTPENVSKPADRSVDPCGVGPADEVVDATIYDAEPDVGREVRYAVFVGPRPGDKPFCVTTAPDRAYAELIASRLPGSWVGQQVVTTQNGSPVDTNR